MLPKKALTRHRAVEERGRAVRAMCFFVCVTTGDGWTEKRERERERAGRGGRHHNQPRHRKKKKKKKKKKERAALPTPQ